MLSRTKLQELFDRHIIDYGGEVCQSKSHNGKYVVIVPGWNHIETLTRVVQKESDDVRITFESIIQELYDTNIYGYYDEYVKCADCNDVIRIVPDNINFKQNYWQSEDGDYLCEDCVRKDSDY
jgi:hypothetical protein